MMRACISQGSWGAVSFLVQVGEPEREGRHGDSDRIRCNYNTICFGSSLLGLVGVLACDVAGSRRVMQKGA